MHMRMCVRIRYDCVALRIRNVFPYSAAVACTCLHCPSPFPARLPSRLLFTICFLLNCSFVLTCKFLNFHHSFSFFFSLIFPDHLLWHATPAKLAMAPSMTATLAALFTAFVCISKCVKCVPHCQAGGGSEAGR